MEQERRKGGLAANAPAKLIDIEQVGRSAAGAEALFQRRKRFKRAIDNMREGPLTPTEQVAELGSEQGAQYLLRAVTFFLAKRKIAERLRAHARNKSARGKCKLQLQCCRANAYTSTLQSTRHA